MTALLILAALAVAITVYLAPAIVAFNRNHRNRLAILVLNLLVGWSGILWIVALVWALTADIVAQEIPRARAYAAAAAG